MPDAGRLAGDAAGSLVETWRRLNTEQRVAAIGSLLLIVSTFGPFSFVEAAIVLTGVSVLYLLKARADRREFHLPSGDGTVVLAAGLWAALLIVVRMFDRPFGLSALALACAAIIAAAGLRERTKRPADDLAPRRPPPDADNPTVRMGPEDELTARMAPESRASPRDPG